MTPTLVRFLNNDPGGLWNAGDTADEMGPESSGVPSLLVLQIHRTGEIITLERPYDRNLIEALD